MKIIETIHSKTSDVTKYIVDDSIYGENEISLLRKETKDVIVMPSATNCKIGCVFCHLKGTTRPAEQFSPQWIVSAVHLIIEEEHLGERPLLISFMGAGEPLLNDNIYLAMIVLHEELPNTKFAISTMVPSIKALERWTDVFRINKDIPMKLHVSIHGMIDRYAIVNSKISSQTIIYYAQKYNEITGNPIEYHYTMMDNYNDSMEELQMFKDAIIKDRTQEQLNQTTVKFLLLNESNGCRRSKVSNEDARKVFEGVTVEFYDPPGRDIGSSCGMFNKSIYNGKQDDTKG